MSLAIITAEQRLAEATVKGMIFGKAGVGKTTLLKTLDPATTLCISAEGGMLSVQRADEFGPRFEGDTMEPANWHELTEILKGFQMNPRPPILAKYKTVFIDSISVASKWCFEWCQKQPDAFSEKKTLADGSPKPDTLGAYGLLGREMPRWVWGWKNIAGLNVWMVGGLEHKDVGGWLPLLMGAKLQAELPYIMDYVVVMARFPIADGTVLTGFHTDPKGEYGTVPVKVRGGGFEPIERPHLGALTQKALGHQTAAPPSVATAA
jgi:hypothetical protein